MAGPKNQWPVPPASRPEATGLWGSRHPAGPYPGDADSIGRGPGGPPALPALPGLPGVPRPTDLKWSTPYDKLEFIAADQVPEFGTRLWLGAGTPVVRAVWGSTTLDCRKDLRGIDGYEPRGTPLLLTEPSGILLEMFIKIRTTTGAVAGMFGTPAGPATTRVLMLEYGDPFIPQEVTAITAPVDITAQVFSGNGVSGDVILRTFNPGPLRYWKVAFAIDMVTADFATLYGPVYTEAACY